MDALIKEILFLGQNNTYSAVHSVFFGGGTPSLLTPTEFDQIMEALHKTFHITSDAEICLETNPNDLTEDYCHHLNRLGFNRVSVGMQSAIERDLQLFKREHTMNTVRQSVENLRIAGINNISLDLIFGSPYQTLGEWEQSLNEAMALKPQNISLYGLELHGGTELTNAIQKGKIARPDDDLAADMYQTAQRILGEHYLIQYEISNWALAGYESKHNIQYWKNQPYLGIGAGAHGYANGYRTIAKRLPSRYIESMNKPKSGSKQPFPYTPALSKMTKISWDDEISETIMMGMRLTQTGIVRTNFHDRFGVDLYEIRRDAIDKHVDRGLLRLTPDHVVLSEEGRLLSNVVLVDLI